MFLICFLDSFFICIEYDTFSTCVGSRTKRRTISWMLVTMHSNISGYIWLAYYALTYTSCWNSYAPQNGQANWDYFTLSIYGTLRIGKLTELYIIGIIESQNLYVNFDLSYDM